MAQRRGWLPAVALAGLAACAVGGDSRVTAPRGDVFQYELRRAGPQEWPACRRARGAMACAQMLTLVRRVNGDLDPGFAQAQCCWECNDGRNACDARRWPGRPVAIGDLKLPEGSRCAATRGEAFAGDGAIALRLYLDWLVRTYGPPFVRDPGDVALDIPPSRPRPTELGVTAGEVICDTVKPAFRITLFRASLEGRPLQAVYGAVAHEFQHVVQIRRDGLACRPTRETKDRLEQEAEAAARKIIPPCG
jgi:hypothetical protein